MGFEDEDEDDLDPLNFNFPPMTVAELLATDALVLVELLLMILVVPSRGNGLLFFVSRRRVGGKNSLTSTK